MNRNLQIKLLGILTAAAVLALVVMSFHVLDSLTTDGTISNDVVGSILTYWALGVLAVLGTFNIRRRWKEIILALCSLLITIMVAELVLRLTEVPAALQEFHGISSSRYHHLYPASAVMNEGLVDGVPIIIRTNEDGLRSGYSREAFLSRKHRIALLGDSFIFGKFVAQEFTCSAILEHELRTRLRTDQVSVLNAGVISYSPLLEERLYDGIVRHYAPSVVLVVLDATDIGDDIKYTEELKQNGGETYFDTTTSEEHQTDFYSAVHQLALPHLQALDRYLRYPFRAVLYRTAATSYGEATPFYDYYDFHLTVDGVAERNRFFIFRHPLECTQMYFERTLSHIGRLSAKVKADGAEFILVVSPRFQHWNPKECPHNWEKGEYSLHEPYQFEYLRFFEEAARRVPFRILNLLPAFAMNCDSALVFPDDPHWNQRGHRVVGEALAGYLLTHNLLLEEHTGK